MTPVFVVAERPRAVTVARARAELRGLAPVDGWRAAAPGVVCCGRVGGEEDAGGAVLAALAGAELIIDATGRTSDPAVIDKLCDDLRRLGTVVHHTSEADGVDPAEALDDDQLDLLMLLALGRSLGQAAADLHLSRRTADRRLAAARAVLGVRATTQAVALVRG